MISVSSLPEPTRERWQPLRLGLIDLYHYDSEEFHFRDGHLLLRGNNGTGKSKVLSLTLPFLLDAQLKPQRVEPDGDAGKKMAWNLLMGRHERRIGYCWIEFGRMENGRAEFLTLGCGMSAVAARAKVDDWFFLAEGRRHGRDFWLMSRERAALTRERLADALIGFGQVFPTAKAYRRAVDERLFHLGETRYAALMDTLVQLRQPQLSKQPNEDNLSEALTESLPPLSADLLAEVATAMNQLEEYRDELAQLQKLAKAVTQFNLRYRIYARIRARREARALRSAQTGFDNASGEQNAAKAAFEQAQQREQQCQDRVDALEAEERRARAAWETLLYGEAAQDATRLREARAYATNHRDAARKAEAALAAARGRAEHEAAELGTRARHADAAKRELAAALTILAACAETIGMAGDNDYLRGAELLAAPERLADAAPAECQAAQNGLADVAARRRKHVTQVRRLLDAAETARREREHIQHQRNGAAGALDAAAADVAEAQAKIDACADELQRAWERHLASLKQLQIENGESILASLSEWTTALDGDNPARVALHAAQQQAGMRLAAHAAVLAREKETVEAERAALDEERQRLQRGEDKMPPAPYQRAPAAQADRLVRPGAPLWQLVEFRDRLDDPQRAGLEAALEASGLLDAWITPDGSVLAADTFDTLLVPRTVHAASLAYSLAPADGPHPLPVPADTILRILRGIACVVDAAAGDAEPAGAEAWVSTSGRFRLGPLQGAWTKPAAEYIGYVARVAAREKRLREIEGELAALGARLVEWQRHAEALEAARRQVEAEWQSMPDDEALRRAHADTAALERQRLAAAERLAEADARLLVTDRRWRDAQQSLEFDAADLRLPCERGPIMAMEEAIGDYASAHASAGLAAQALRHHLPELRAQRARADAARAAADDAASESEERRMAAEEAEARADALQQTVGARVEELERLLANARIAVEAADTALKSARNELGEAKTQRGAGAQRVADAGRMLLERIAARAQAVGQLQSFAATGLLAVALPDLEQPPHNAAWTIEPALTLARRAEQLLSGVADDDAEWARIQREISGDLTELQRSLAALGHRAQADTSDYGLIVSIVYRNRAERPDVVEAGIADEIAQRHELLTQREREVLENHLQAEVATAVQRLMQDAQRRIDAINGELGKHPTSTGIKFRLVWQPLAETDGAPVGLEAARRRLLNTSADAWSADDRQQVGDMLQHRITAERIRADAVVGVAGAGGGGGSLFELLSRALDYRRWHRFRVERWQDGQWRRLSGPASSGERALGLTVPLFAAVSSFYSHGSFRQAPRLVLLDEAFAGIDDEARAHCMALVREFDLDFVMTSEREWGCYAALPGVAISHLMRREGIDAVFVSRWTWDGRKRREDAHAQPRFPDAKEAGQAAEGVA
jgi:uncharacterized protein (TIGR02680 family)